PCTCSANIVFIAGIPLFYKNNLPDGSFLFFTGHQYLSKYSPGKKKWLPIPWPSARSSLPAKKEES
ncbi:MAG: hypothetical protein ABW019_06705, partial [Chitinophagaceae bacterium]